jgi:hypothetical protein
VGKAASPAWIYDHAQSFPSAETYSGNSAGKGSAVHQVRFLWSREMESYLASGIWEGSFVNHSIRDAEGKDHHTYI